MIKLGSRFNDYPLMKTIILTLSLSLPMAVSGTAGDKLIKPIDSKAPILDAKAPVGPAAPCLSYDYIDLDYQWFDSPGVGLEGGDGYALSFSKTLGELFFLTGGYTNASAGYLFNNDFYDLESHRYNLGLGARFSLSECVDLTIEGGATHQDNRYGNNPDFSYDSWGYYVGPGLRARAGRFEGFAKVFYVDRGGVPAQLGFDDEGWVFNPGLLYHLNDRLALKLAADLAENRSQITFGARINF